MLVKAVPTPTLRARAYVRVSSVNKERAEQLISDDMQIEEGRRYAEYNGFKFDAEESRASADLDVSGFSKPWRERPGLMRLLEAAKRGEFDVLIFYKLSRLSRRIQHGLEIIEEFEKHGVSFHFVSERIDSSSSQGRFLRNILLSMAEMTAEDISSFVKASMRQKALAGGVHSSIPSWLKRNEEGTIEIVESQAAAMRRLVQLRIAGQGQQTIARTLNEEGYKTSDGASWNQQQIHKYLLDHWLDTMTGTGYWGRGKPDAIAIPNALPAIITQDEAERLRAIQALYRERHQHGSGRHAHGRAGSMLLSGIIHCPCCGARMHLSTEVVKGAKVRRYSCPRKVSLSSDHPLNTASVVDHIAEDAVLRVVRHALSLPPAPLSEESSPKREVDYAGQRAEVEAKIDKLVEMNLRGRLNDDDFERHYNPLVVEKARIEDAETEANTPEYIALADTLAGQDVLTREEMRQLVLLMVDRIEPNVTIPGNTLRSNTKNDIRYVRVVLRFATSTGDKTFLAQQHRASFKGEKGILACDAPVHKGVVSYCEPRLRYRPYTHTEAPLPARSVAVFPAENLPSSSTEAHCARPPNASPRAASSAPRNSESHGCRTRR
jgi:DNA invertase Pin-like site-specific DNA recombinase